MLAYLLAGEEEEEEEEEEKTLAKRIFHKHRCQTRCQEHTLEIESSSILGINVEDSRGSKGVYTTFSEPCIAMICSSDAENSKSDPVCILSCLGATYITAQRELIDS